MYTFLIYGKEEKETYFQLLKSTPVIGSATKKHPVLCHFDRREKPKIPHPTGFGMTYGVSSHMNNPIGITVH